MGSEFVQDPFWGNWASGLMKGIGNATGNALDNTSKVEQILALRERRARETEQWNEGKKAVDAYGNAVPAASVPPSVRDVPYQPQGPVNPADADVASLQVATNPSFPDRPAQPLLPSTTIQEQFIDPRALAAANARRNLAIAGGRATILKDPSTWAQQQAYGEVASTGVPTDPRERARIQFQTTGRFPTSDESKTPNAQNFVIVENGQSTGQGFASLNGGRTTLDGTPVRLQPGQTLMEAGQVGLARPNPIESAPIAQNNFNQLAAKLQAKVAAGEHLTNAELDAARQMRDSGWQKEIKLEKDNETGRMMPVVVYKIPPPTTGVAGWLHNALDDIDRTLPGPQRQQQQPPAPPPASTFDPFDPNSPAPGTPAAAAAAPPPPAPPAAPVDPPALVQPQAPIGTGDPQPVITSYRQQPVIIGIENAKNGYSSLLSSMPNDDRTSDLAMIVGAAKVLDPPSVVREGEVENVRKTGGIMDKFIGLLQGAEGKSGLTTQVRAQLWQMVNEKLKLDVANAQQIREQHAVQLRQRGVDPEKYLPPLPQIVPVDPRIIRSRRIDVKGDQGAAEQDPNAKPTLSVEEQKALDRKLGIQ